MVITRTSNKRNSELIDCVKKKLVNVAAFIFKILGNIRKTKIDNHTVVILAFHKLGDTVFTISAIKNIIESHKNKIFLFCHPESKEIYELSISGIEYYTFSSEYFFYRGMLARRQVREKLNGLNPKIIYDLTGSVKSASIIFNSKANDIIGTNKSIYKSLYTKFTPLRTDPHCVDIYMDAIKLNITDQQSAGIYVSSNSNINRIIIHPFAGWRAKEWSLSKYISLASLLNVRFDCEIIVPSSKNISSDVLDEIKLLNIKLIICNSLNEMINRIKHASYFIGNDSGPIHIANLLGVPTFTIYGPTNPEYHKPLNGVNSFYQKKLFVHLTLKKKCVLQVGEDSVVLLLLVWILFQLKKCMKLL